MPKLEKTEFNKIKELSKKWLFALAENPFLTSLALILISLIIGSFIFYQYSILVEETNVAAPNKSLVLEEKSLKNVLEIWQARQKKFEAAGSNQYPNPFQLTK
jgi:hypothetical protein